MANRMLMVTIVRPIAISGEISAIAFDRSARFSSTNCMSRVLLLQTAPAHQQTELLAVGIRGRQRFGEAAVEHHRDPVGGVPRPPLRPAADRGCRPREARSADG